MDYRLTEVELQSLEKNTLLRGARRIEHAAMCSKAIKTCDCPIAVRYRVLVVERDVFVERLRRVDRP